MAYGKSNIGGGGLRMLPGTDILITSNASGVSYTSMTKTLEYTLEVSGTYRVSYYMNVTTTGYDHWGRAQLYKNGSPIGTLRQLESDAPAQTFSQDVALVKGDKIQIYTQIEDPYTYIKTVISGFSLGIDMDIVVIKTL